MAVSNSILRLNPKHRFALSKQLLKYYSAGDTVKSLSAGRLKDISTLQHFSTCAECNNSKFLKQILFSNSRSFFGSKKSTKLNSPDYREKREHYYAFGIAGVFILVNVIAYSFMETHQDYDYRDKR